MTLLNTIEGGRSEYLAWYALSTIGYCTPVPRQSDGFLTDFLVYLFQQRATTVVPTGPALLIQIKSNDDAITLDGEALTTFLGLELPYYIGVVDKEGAKLTVFQTRERISFRYHGFTRISVKLEPSPLGFTNPKGSAATLYLGAPIAQIAINQMENLSERESFRAVMSGWANLDTRVLGWNVGGFPISLSVGYETNEAPALSSTMRLQYNDTVLEPAMQEFQVICNAVDGMLSMAEERGNHSYQPARTRIAELMAALASCATATAES